MILARLTSSSRPRPEGPRGGTLHPRLAANCREKVPRLRAFGASLGTTDRLQLITHELQFVERRSLRYAARASSFSQGAAWKALISTYIGTMPPSSDASGAVEQSMVS